MGFIDAIKAGHAKTFQYSGRSSRSEYWWFGLYASVSLIGSIFLLVQFINTSLGFFLTVAYSCYALWVVLISLSLMTRRFHDIGYSGAWTFVYFLSGVPAAITGTEPGLLSIIFSLLPLLFLIFFCKAGQPADNKYGPNPLGLSESASPKKSYKRTEDSIPKSQSTILEKPAGKEIASHPKEETMTLRDNEYDHPNASVSEPEPRVDKKESAPVSDIEVNEEHFAKAYSEIETGNKRDGLWAMSYATTSNEEEAKKKYIKLRAEELQRESLALAAEQRPLKEKQEAEEKLKELVSWAKGRGYEVIKEPHGSWKLRQRAGNATQPLGAERNFRDDADITLYLASLKRRSE